MTIQLNRCETVCIDEQLAQQTHPSTGRKVVLLVLARDKQRHNLKRSGGVLLEILDTLFVVLQIESEPDTVFVNTSVGPVWSVPGWF
jgi:hypothetical protein